VRPGEGFASPGPPAFSPAEVLRGPADLRLWSPNAVNTVKRRVHEAKVVEFLAAGAALRERRYELIKGLDLVGGRSCAPANASGNPGLIAVLERITTADNVRKIAGENWLRVLGTATAP
jgi:hypothetical protein